jgi:lysyl-tRNA synthetase class 1
VWEFGQLVTRKHREIESARRAIESYLQSVETNYYANDVQASNFLARALSLSISVNDRTLITRSKDAAFKLHQTIGTFGKGSMWWILFDTLYDVNAVSLSDVELVSIIDGLEGVLKIASDRTVPETFDTWVAQGAAERLERHYRKIQRPDEVRRVVETYGRAFEEAARDAEPLLAVAWLQPVYEKYRDLGMHEATKRVQLALESRPKASPASMKRVEVPINITEDELKKYIDALTDDGLEYALRKVAARFIPNANDVPAFNERMKDVAPLSSLIPMRIFEGDFVAAVVGSQDDDPDGRLVYQIGNRIAFDAPWLGMALDRIVERYKMSPEQLMMLLRSSPLFDASRYDFIAEGVSAALGGDPIKAIHVLIPQIEHMLRSLAGLLGIPKTTAGGVKGTMQTRGLGELLNDKILRNSLEENIRLYLVAFLVDQRGLNLRNRVAHGLMELHQMEKSLSNRLVHVLLVLSIISIEGRAAPFQAFRVVRHTYNDKGLLEERAVLSGRHQTREDAILAAKLEAAKSSPWRFNDETSQWRITDKSGKVHFLAVEGYPQKNVI